jgi:hypothetical protein
MKNFTVRETKEWLIERLKEEPELIQNEEGKISQETNEDMRAIYWPASVDIDNWSHMKTTRPTEDHEGNKLSYTDRVVMRFENDFWFEHNKKLEAEITIEFEQFKEIRIYAKW